MKRPTALSTTKRDDLALARGARRAVRLSTPQAHSTRIAARKGAGSYQRRTKHAPLD